eukprot:8598-Heterococcus_DN1.PRE.3
MRAAQAQLQAREAEARRSMPEDDLGSPACTAAASAATAVACIGGNSKHIRRQCDPLSRIC